MSFKRSRLFFMYLGIIICILCITSSSLQAELPDFTDLAENTGPAVVNISTVKTVQTSKRMKKFFNPFQERKSPFNDFFEKFFPDMPEKRKKNSLGSGFIISEDGYIVTNAHVIRGADKIKVNLQGENDASYSAEVVGKDGETDLALLKIDVDRELQVLEFGNSDQIKVGEWVLAIGNPFGLDHTVTAGIISAKGRVIGAGPYDNFIQTDASINPGNSGGPLLNLQGKVVGINSAIVARGENIGFAIPSNMAEDVIKQLKKYQEVKRGWLGVSIQDADQNTAKALNLPDAKGALVSSVRKGEPADEAGIEVGDVIVSVQGHSIKDADELTRVIGDMSPGQEVKITLWRNGEAKKVTVELGLRDLDRQAAKEEEERESSDKLLLGMKVRKLTEKEARSLNLNTAKGLVVLGIKQGSPASEANIQRGDVILRANKRPVGSNEELKQVIEQAEDKKVIMLFINRKGQNLFTTISWGEE